MNTHVLNLLNYVLIGFECIMASYLGAAFFRRRYHGVLHALAVFALFLACIVYLKIFGQTIAPKLIVAVLVHMIWIKACFHTGTLKALFLSIFLVSFWFIFDTLCMIGLSALIQVDYRSLTDSPFSYFLLCFGVKSFELLGLVVLCTLVKHHAQIWSMSWQDWLRILFFPVSSLLISCELVLMYNKSPNLAAQLALCACILLFADVMSVFLLDHLENQQIAIRDNAILQQDLKTERESINTWVDAYREERKRSHDFQNQLAVLRGMIDENAPPEQFLHYLDGLLNTELPKTRYINTNRPVADVLISQKAAIARNKHITLQLHLDDLFKFPLSDDELVVVLANLLDNAMTAAEKIPEEAKRRIFVRMECAPAVSYLYIENTTAAPVPIKNGRVVTRRSELSGHGFGIQNITTILDRRHAIYAFEYHPDTAVFSFSAQLTESCG